MSDKHTPGPWRLGKSGLKVVAGDPDPNGGYPDGRAVAVLPPDLLMSRGANGAFIVRAVNSFADLLAACENAAAFLRRHCAETLGLPAEDTAFGGVVAGLEAAAREARGE